MSQSINTPYGEFKSIAAAAREISHLHAPEFIATYPWFKYPYNRTMDHHNKGSNNSTIHYIYNVINHHLLGSATSGRRQPYKGWSRN